MKENRIVNTLQVRRRSVEKRPLKQNEISGVPGKKRSKVNKNSNKQTSSITSNSEELYGILQTRNIDKIQFGVDKIFSTWYGSNVYFDKESLTLGYHEYQDYKHQDSKSKDIKKIIDRDKIWLDTLFVCEYCFKYTDRASELATHTNFCNYKTRLPGRIKYRSPEYTIRRVKGSKHQLFCQCMCLFTKLFLDNKSIYFKVQNYDFYILYETNNNKPLGFFSKDLFSYDDNNLACILIFPPYQRRRLGSLLIEFSYHLSRADDIVSGPELPLSPFGLVSYLKYWTQVLCTEMVEGKLANNAKLTLEEISQVTGLRVSDVITTLKHLSCLGENNEICVKVMSEWLRKNQSKSTFMIDESYLLIDD